MHALMRTSNRADEWLEVIVLSSATPRNKIEEHLFAWKLFTIANYITTPFANYNLFHHIPVEQNAFVCI